MIHAALALAALVAAGLSPDALHLYGPPRHRARLAALEGIVVPAGELVLAPPVHLPTVTRPEPVVTDYGPRICAGRITPAEVAKRYFEQADAPMAAYLAGLGWAA
jgi:hypothetical protein